MADVNISKYTTQVVREGSKPAAPGFVVSEGQDPVNPPGTNNYVPYTGATANVELGEFGLETGFVNLDTTPTNIPTEQGAIYWDDSKSTAALIMNGTLQHIGQDVFYYVKNSTGSSIPKGTAVRFNGTDGASGHLLIAPFLANGTYPSSYFMGVTAETIANGSFGQVMHFGELNGINTSGYTAGALLYASTTVAGGFQTTAPVAPNNIVLIAAAVNSKNNGEIVVRPTYGSNINQDEGVKITSPTTGDLLQLQAGGLWENKTKAQILGGTSSQFVKGDGSLDSTSYQPLLTNPVTGTGTTNFVPKYTSGGLAIIGNSTIQDDGSAITLGNPTLVVGSLTATSIIKSGGTSSQYLMADGSVSTLTNPVTGTGTTNYLPKFTGSTTIGNSAIIDNGTSIEAISRTFIVNRGSHSAFGFEIDQQSTFAFGSTNGKRVAIIRDSTLADNGLQFGYDTVDKTGIIAGSATSSGAGIDFYTFNGSTWGSRTRITSGGNLLVGTTTDSGFKLDVNGTGRFSASGSTNLVVQRTGSNGVFMQLLDASGNSVFLGGNNGDFQVQTPSAGFSNKLVVTNSGNVGIGTSSPTTKLDVRGIVAAIAGSGSNGLLFGDYGTDAGTFSISAISGRNIVIRDEYAGVERLRISSTGFVSAGATTNGRLGVRGFTNDSSGYSFEAANSSGNTLFIVRNDGATTVSGKLLVNTFTPGSSPLRLVSLPTSSAGLSSGDVWNDSGTLKIA
jgi:hypothetical protein